MPPSESKPLHVSQSPLDVEAAISGFAGPVAQLDRIRTASILLVPTEIYHEQIELGSPGVRHEQIELAFPELTREILLFIEAHLDPSATVEALTHDEEYIEFSFNSETLIIPEMVTFGITVAQVLIPIVASFVKRRLVDRHGTQEGSTVSSRLHVKRPTGDHILYEYDGPADTYERTLLTALTTLDTKSNGDDDDEPTQDADRSQPAQ